MDAFHAHAATLHVGTLAVEVLACDYHAHQNSDLQGRSASPVYGGELRLALAVPPGLELPTWAYDPRKLLDGHVAFASPDGLSPSLRLEFEDGLCVSYNESLVPNAAGHTAFACELTLLCRRIRKLTTTIETDWHHLPAGS